MIKTAKSEDLTTVVNLANALWPDTSIAALQDEMNRLIFSETALIALYFENNEPIAFAQCQLRNDYVEGTDSSPVGYLEGIYVCENRRRRGVARSLLDYCEKWAKANNCFEFASDCEINNTDSYHFHIAVGFIEANRIICFQKKL